MARVFGLEVLHMADADVLPYDYVTYGKQLNAYLEAAQKKASEAGMKNLDFRSGPGRRAEVHRAGAAGERETGAARSIADLRSFNNQLRNVEEGFLNQAGLPGRPWFKHTI